MGSNSALEQTIDKILTQTEKDVLSNIHSALSESNKTLDDSIPKLEREYDKIISDGKKEADKIEKQLIGSSDLEARNNKLLILEKAVDDVFTKAIEQISNTNRNDDYSKLIMTLLDESTKILGTTKVVIYTNSKDKNIIQSLLSKYPGAELSPESITCLGGITVKSKDGAMKFDNTLDARIQRMKPLIRKEIATKFGVGN
ncbi:MAG: V-type ATP synthase subunit E [Nitrosopumilales archaeon CG15_BIG_FIL_POST_REV_8_21_14_020_33_23]|nr:MAG: V-type ATP synthase subunit E [Nitrosopumilales archaeon CG11_big_fil_rev_8_21_14_0_20_33_24]PIW36101.1 MAG: V-type ATP synthase subunit E [Nitrosopumilales archaeon CG15_BIG_FIL_POST_REV_8_21_14_020_33_23]